MFHFQVNGTTGLFASPVKDKQEPPASSASSMQDYSPTVTGKPASPRSPLYSPITHTSQRSIVYSRTSPCTCLLYSCSCYFVCLSTEGLEESSVSVSISSLFQLVCFSVTPSFLNLTLSWPFVSCSRCSQTCPLTFPLFLSFRSVHISRTCVCVCVGLCVFVYVCVFPCLSGLGRLRPPCWTWLNVLITGSGIPMRSVIAWKCGNRSRSASYRYTGGIVWRCMAPWTFTKQRTRPLLDVGVYFSTWVSCMCVFVHIFNM